MFFGATGDIATSFEIDEDPSDCAKSDFGSFDNITMRGIEKVRFT